MKLENQKKIIVNSLFWKLMERGGTQGIQFMVQIILARLLLPADYGLVALVMVFILLANVFVQSGFNTALIQKKEADAVDFSSVFYLSLFIAGILYMTLYLISPFIAEFYRAPQLINILRVLSITLFFGAFNSIQNAFVARNMMFKKLLFSSLGAILISGTAGIVAAYAGWGVWALVVQQLTNQLSIIVILLFTVTWRPRLMFSLKRVNVLFSFGWKLLVSSLIDTLYVNLRSLIIGKIYTPAVLGFYNRGEQFPALIVGNINGSIQAVMLPALSLHQEDRIRVKDMVRRSIVTSAFIIFPLMVGLAVTAEPLVKILLTDKWLPCVPFLQIACASYALYPIHTANLQAINALGRSDIFLKLEIVKKIVGFSILGISIQFGVYAIAWGALIAGVLSTFINAYPNLKLFNYSYKEQLKDIIPSLAISLLMGIAVSSIHFLNIGAWQILMAQIISGIILYIGLAKVSKNESYSYLIVTISDILKGRKEANK